MNKSNRKISNASCFRSTKLEYKMTAEKQKIDVEILCGSTEQKCHHKCRKTVFKFDRQELPKR